MEMPLTRYIYSDVNSFSLCHLESIFYLAFILFEELYQNRPNSVCREGLALSEMQRSTHFAFMIFTFSIMRITHL